MGVRIISKTKKGNQKKGENQKKKKGGNKKEKTKKGENQKKGGENKKRENPNGDGLSLPLRSCKDMKFSC